MPPTWTQTNKSVRKLRKRLRQITHLKQRAKERDLTAEEAAKVGDEAMTRSKLQEQEALFATLEPPEQPMPEPEPELEPASVQEDQAGAAQLELEALLGTAMPLEEEQPTAAAADAASSGEGAEHAEHADAASLQTESEPATFAHDDTDTSAQQVAVTAQAERLAALEADPPTSITANSDDSAAVATAPGSATDLAPTPPAAVAPPAPRKPAVSTFARRSARFSVTVLEGHSDGITGVALLGERGDTVATTSFDCTVKWWDSRTGAELKSLVCF